MDIKIYYEIGEIFQKCYQIGERSVNEITEELKKVLGILKKGCHTYEELEERIIIIERDYGWKCERREINLNFIGKIKRLYEKEKNQIIIAECKGKQKNYMNIIDAAKAAKAVGGGIRQRGCPGTILSIDHFIGDQWEVVDEETNEVIDVSSREESSE
ncbi:MAG: hypothetical protein FWG31_05440 [Oscillospiraceae bacterium]|nr:hypothetical protein [Oscillospiraceae bacterium]